MKDRRRARKLSDEAWEAVDADNLDLAEKFVRRAAAAQIDNPVLWNDQGMILVLRGKDAEAAEAFRAAISLAPTFAEAFANLARLRARQGFIREAVAMQSEAVKYAPQNGIFGEQLAAYRALHGEDTAKPNETCAISAQDSQGLPPPCTPRSGYSEQLAKLDWQHVGDRLTRDGCVLIRGLMEAGTCSHVRSLFVRDDLFAKTVEMDQPEFGLGVYRYFRDPIPDVVVDLRQNIYPHVARIANHWQELLGEAERYPEDWYSFRDECHRAGQRHPTPILLRYVAGGFNALHRDLRGSIFFPIQMAVVLSLRFDATDPVSDGFRGGEFLFCDVPEKPKSRRRKIACGLGDAVLFCTRDRLVSVGGAWGLQPVKHGVCTITAGERFVLGVPFHEYR